MAKQAVDDLVRAGQMATRKALVEDPTLAAFLSPEQYAQLAEFAKPPPRPTPVPHPGSVVKIEPGMDVLKAMRPRGARLEAIRQVIENIVVWSTVAIGIAWLSYLEVANVLHR